MIPRITSENVLVEFPIVTLDIGGTDTATIEGGTAAENHWTSLTKYGHVLYVAKLGGGSAAAWNAGDSVLTVTVQQASSATGTGVKTVKAFTIADGTLDAENDTFTVDVDSSELDVANGFTHVRLLVAATDNVGVDEITVAAIKSMPRFSNENDYTLVLPKDQSAD